MASKIRVYGKAQNRTALGIVNAYIVMHPHATLEDLRRAFPASLNPDCGVKDSFVGLDEARAVNDKAGISLYFAKEGEPIVTGDGSQVCLAQVWTKNSFERIVEHAKLYDIEIAQFDPAEKGFGKKGSYHLEMLNGYVPPVPEAKKKGVPVWLWLLLGLIALGIVALFFVPREKEVVVEEKIVEKIVVDTVYVQQIEDIERSFNAAQFEQGKADLNDDAKLALHDLAKVLRQNPELKLAIEGHTSAEGDAAMNQVLSENRAQAAVDFLVNKEGIEAVRLTAVGKGATELKDADNPQSEVNRRTEFVLIEE